MKYDLLLVKQVARKYPSTTCVILSVVTLFFDFVTGRDIHFPLLFALPVSLAAWMGRRKLAYILSVLLPVMRVTYEVLWPNPERLLIEGTNAAVEVLALALYVFFVGRKGVESRQMKQTISVKDEEMQHLRSFTRMIGTTLLGRGISPGLAEGVALVCPPVDEFNVAKRAISPAAADAELIRIDRAFEAATRELVAIRERPGCLLTNKELALIDAHLAMLEDASLAKKCKRRVSEDLICAEYAVAEEVRSMEQLFLGMKQEYMRQRSADVRDIGRQLLRNFPGSPEGASPRMAPLAPGTVLVMEELPLATVLEIDPANVAAIVTERMGPASHVAILARGRNIPAVCDIKGATSLLASGEHLLVDAEKGTVTVAPTQAQAAHFASRKALSAAAVPDEAGDSIQRAVTKDNVAVTLYANIGRADEAALVHEYRMDGVGLFRSEFLFLNASRPPDLEAQTAAYKEVASLLNPHPVVIRTMDLGGDKIPLFSRAANDMAFSTGLRGLAYSLTEKTLFRTQLQAICQASRLGNVKVMFPMVMGFADMREARAAVAEVSSEGGGDKLLPVGAMIETPAAVLDIEGVLELADFVCIGTNDLSHSILAMNRESQGGCPGILPFLHPAVLRATDQIVRAAGKRGVPVSVCGEAASDPAIACLLIGMGVRDLSMNPFQTKRVRNAISNLTLAQAQAVAQSAVAAATPKEIQGVLACGLRDVIAS